MSNPLNAPAKPPASQEGPWPETDLRLQGPDRPALAGYTELDQLRAQGPAFALSSGNLLFTRHEEILEIAQNADVFHSKAYDPITGGPAEFTLVPQAIDGPQHVKWRRLLGPVFSPGSISRLDDVIRERVNELIDGFIDDGRCDFIKDFSLRFPTSVFLTHVMGLPVEQLDRFIAWETDILHPKADDPMAAYQKSVRAQTEVTEYLAEIIAERRLVPPEDRGSDLISLAMSWKIDGEDVSDVDLKSFYLLMFEAGLDTVTAELGYGFHHLATHAADRQRMASDPAVIPNAVEELLRAYPIVTINRTAMEDTQIDGCPISKGQRVILSLPSAGRDESTFENGTAVDFDRENISHLTFGAGPHRCLGSHLARHELAIAYEEWHKRIPEYQVDPDAEYDESCSALFGLNSLPLVWSSH